MNYALIQSVKETTSIEEVNELLKDDNWRLMAVSSTSNGFQFCLGKARIKEDRRKIQNS